MSQSQEKINGTRKTVRVKKEDSAYVYAILESYEGITSYSTLDFKREDPFRDLELRIPTDFIEETQQVLRRLQEEGMIFSLEGFF